jgi:hypothetical protein
MIQPSHPSRKDYELTCSRTEKCGFRLAMWGIDTGRKRLDMGYGARSANRANSYVSENMPLC